MATVALVAAALAALVISSASGQAGVVASRDAQILEAQEQPQQIPEAQEQPQQIPETLPDCVGTPSNEQQLKGEVLSAICSHFGDGNHFLVFGTGYDSPFWMDSNPEGVTRFIEDHQDWIKFQPDRVQEATTVVTYSSSMETALQQIDNETFLMEFYYTQLPADVKDWKWDTILVDAPQGWGDGPGRGQSIYTALLLAKPTSYVYVDDCEREVEAAYVQHWFVEKGWTKVVHDTNGHGGTTCVLYQEQPEQFLEYLPPCLGTPSNEQQLNGEVLSAICSHFAHYKTFLVFGTGYDSPFWMDSNPQAPTLFLEDHKDWIEFQPDRVQEATTVVTYSSSMETALQQVDNETMLREFFDTQLPTKVKSKRWDTILVDAPQGWGDGPGRGQSIYTALLLAKPTSYVYVDDCERPVETAYVQHWFVEKGWTKVVHDTNGHNGTTCVLYQEQPSLDGPDMF